MSGYAAVLAEGREESAELGDILVARVLGQEPGRGALERRPGGDDLHDLLAGLAHHEEAAAGHAPDQPILLEADDRLTDRGPADTKLLGQAPLVEADLLLLVVDVHLEDGPLELLVGEVGDGT